MDIGAAAAALDADPARVADACNAVPWNSITCLGALIVIVGAGWIDTSSAWRARRGWVA